MSAPPRPRLVLLTSGYFDRGGVATRSRTLARGFAERGWEVRVITRAAINAPLREPPADGVRVVEVPAPTGRLGSTVYLVAALAVALAWGVRARAFLAMQLLSPTTVAAIATAFVRKPFICLTSMTGELSEVRLITGSRFASLRTALVRRAACGVAQSRLGAEELRRLMPPERVAVVATPTDPVAPSPAARTAGTVLYAGRLAEEKGVLDLLDSWPSVVLAASSARLVLAGGGGRDRSVEKRVRQMARQPPLACSVELPGWVDDIGERLSCCDVFVLPSHTEGMSNALVEAVVRGCVVVASRIPGNTEVLGEEYPLLFRAHDSADLAQTLIAALGDDSLRSAALACVRERAHSFETPTVVAELERLLLSPRL